MTLEEENREILQKEAEELWYKNNCQGLLGISVGGGKSWIAMKIHKDLQKKKKKLKVMLVTPTIILHEVNWKIEYEKAKILDLYYELTRVCYVSLGKYNPNDFDLIIFDEVHHISNANEEEFLINLDTSKTKTLGLSGTPPTKGDKFEWFDNYFPVIFKSNVNESAGKIVNEFIINIIYTELDPIKKVIKSGRKDKPFYNTESDAYKYLSSKIAECSERNDFKGRQWASLSRKVFLENLDSRIIIAKKIRDKFLKNKRYLIFAPSILKAVELCPNALHSKSKDKNLLQKFIDGEINELSSVRMLNEGVTLNNLAYGLICKLDSTDKTFFQQLGRILRNPGKVSNAYVIVYKNTVEETYLKDILKTISPERINYIDIKTL